MEYRWYGWNTEKSRKVPEDSGIRSREAKKADYETVSMRSAHPWWSGHKQASRLALNQMLPALCVLQTQPPFPRNALSWMFRFDFPFLQIMCTSPQTVLPTPPHIGSTSNFHQFVASSLASKASKRKRAFSGGSGFLCIARLLSAKIWR